VKLFFLVLLLSAAHRDSGPAPIPIDVHESHAYVAVSVNGSAPLWFLIDSGAAAPVNLIDRTAAAKLGLATEGERETGAIGGKARVTFTAAPVALTIGDTQLPPARLAVMSIADQESPDGHPVAGILGFPFFQAYNPTLDYPRRRMWLTQRPPQPARDALPLEVVEKGCRIKALLTLRPGEPPVMATLIVDTGFDGELVLNSPFVRRHGLLDGASGEVAGGALGGSTGGRTMQLPALKLGKHRLKGVRTRLSTDSEGAFASAEVDGFVGGGVLQQFVATFDYAHGRLKLRR